MEAAAPIASIYSPSHELNVRRISDRADRGGAERRLGTPAGAVPALVSRSENGGVPASVFAYPDPTVGGGYFLLMAGLPTTIDDAARMKREVTVVIDRSGSMAGPKMDQVRDAARQIIEGLEDGEAFNIIDYSTAVAVVRGGAGDQGPIEHKRRPGVPRIDSARGGTNIHDALVEALRQPTWTACFPSCSSSPTACRRSDRLGELAIREVVEQGQPARPPHLHVRRRARRERAAARPHRRRQPRHLDLTSCPTRTSNSRSPRCSAVCTARSSPTPTLDRSTPSGAGQHAAGATS